MKQVMRNTVIVGVACAFLIMSASFVWVATLEIPTLDGFESRLITQSTKIYDRTGEVLLFDLHDNVRRTVVPLSEISRDLKNATIAIEDAEFYEHKGIKPRAIARAVLANLKSGTYSQGGSTITQQVVKNTLLTSEKKISRKVKEWILALKVEKILTKDAILELYLNEAPYGGNVYGVEEAAQRFFATSAKDITLAQAAYMAALPQAPSRYSPYGGRADLLDARKNLVLEKMLEKGFITQQAYQEAKEEVVVFEQYGDTNIKAPHFVFYVQEYLEEKYGRDALYEGGLKVITTLDYNLQQIGEDVVKKYAFENEEKFNAENAALVAIDPKTGQIITMVGSRDYFDETIDGKFNITTAYRQPGSTFKPIVYAAAFEKGYTPETTVFDVPTQFSVTCEPDVFETNEKCYSPVNYDGIFRGPITLRNALAQSINIPAIKVLHLTTIKTALETAEALGIMSLDKGPNYYGYSLVLGGGEVSPLELAGAYAVFANDGVRQDITPILTVEDSSGTVLEEYEEKEGQRILSQQATRLLSSVLTDVDARTPAYGQNSFYFGNQQVAVKTGTTNDFRDVWIMGYTPNISVATWGGNNDNSPIVKKVAGFVLAPMWREFMDQALPLIEAENFTPPEPEEDINSLKPVLKGFWQGSIINPSIHSILYWVLKDDPRGALPTNPRADAQYDLWEYAVGLWAQENSPQLINTENISGGVIISSPINGREFVFGETVDVSITTNPTLITNVEYFLDGIFMGSSNKKPYSFSVIPNSRGEKNLRVIVRTLDSGVYEAQTTFVVR
tara:strand:+ start:2196 stop:4559 length:2364 start_codon:yes stop_codon:yes gene_type:complete